MVLEEQLSELIGDVYDAALNPALWPAALAGASHFVGGPSTALYTKDATSKNGNVYFDDGGIDPGFVALYFEKYVKLDPTTTRHFFTEIGHSVSTTDIMPYDEFLQTRFYREWAHPQHLVDHLSAVLDKSLTSVSLFGVFRHERDGLVDDEARRRMALIVPHVRRAVLIGRAMAEKTSETAAFADTFDAIRAGMFLIDASGRVAHANVAGHELLATGTLLRGPGGRLTATDASTDHALHEIFAGASGGDTIIGTRGIALPLAATDGERYVAHVLPLTSGARQRAGYAAVAALFVQKAILEQPSAPEVLLKAYGLTPTELRVLLAVVEIGGAPEVAEALGIAETTVKFHLKALFEKTGSHRQADLIKLVAGYSTPLAG
jgi:DNA-binding CsgD family transcriptional regulator